MYPDPEGGKLPAWANLTVYQPIRTRLRRSPSPHCGHFTSMRVEHQRVRGPSLHLDRLVRDCRRVFDAAQQSFGRTRPSSTTATVPVTYEANDEASTTAMFPMSEVSPNRSRGTIRVHISSGIQRGASE